VEEKVAEDLVEEVKGVGAKVEVKVAEDLVVVMVEVEMVEVKVVGAMEGELVEVMGAVVPVFLLVPN